VSSGLAETVHVAECLGGKPTIGLHVYGGDIMGEVPRHMWDPQTLAEHALDWKYVRDLRAGRIASALGAIARRYVRFWHKADIA
jgi:hypothetical protein